MPSSLYAITEVPNNLHHVPKVPLMFASRKSNFKNAIKKKY